MAHDAQLALVERRSIFAAAAARSIRGVPAAALPAFKVGTTSSSRPLTPSASGWPFTATPAPNVPRATRVVIRSGYRAKSPGRGRLVTAAHPRRSDGHVPRTRRVVFRSGSRAYLRALAAEVSDLRHTPVRVWVDRAPPASVAHSDSRPHTASHVDAVRLKQYRRAHSSQGPAAGAEPYVGSATLLVARLLRLSKMPCVSVRSGASGGRA